MNVKLSEPVAKAAGLVDRALLVVWQHPLSRKFIPVAELRHRIDGTYVFEYLPDALEMPDFFALVEYPDLRKAYVSAELPVFFANRVMSRDRYNYDQYLGWLGLEDVDPEAVPVEVLARTGGGRATDTFHIVDRPLRDNSAFLSRFFVSGIRYADGAVDNVTSVSPGDPLELRRQPDNAFNSKAVIVNVQSGRQLGWVPDWLCAEVTDMLDEGWNLELVAERVNVDAPAHTRLMCLLRGTR